jgi:hypothetical protein
MGDGEPTLLVIAQELVTLIKGNVSTDRIQRASAHTSITAACEAIINTAIRSMQDAAVLR